MLERRQAFRNAWLPLAALAVGAALLAAQPAAADVTQPALIGGSPAGATAFPFVGALVLNVVPNASNGQFCSGTLIAPKLVVTTGSCVQGLGPTDFDVVLRRSKLSAASGERIHVASVVIDPSYSVAYGAAIRDDVALVRLATASTATPVALAPTTADPAAGSIVAVVGWGVSNLNGATPDDQLRVQLPIVSDATCGNAYGRLFDSASMICAGRVGVGGAGPCDGDGGDPLLAGAAGRYRLMAMVSWGYGCARPDFPMVGARLTRAALHAWVLSNPPVAPANTVPPSIDGTVNVGQTLHCDRGVWSGPSLHFTYSWYRDVQLVQSGARASYRLTAADRDSAIGCTVVATNPSGAATADAGGVGPVKGPVVLDRRRPRVLSVRGRCAQRACTITLTARDDRHGTGVGSVEVIVVGADGPVAILDARRLGRTVSWRTRMRLAPGRYTLLARATDRAGNVQARFTHGRLRATR